MIPAHNASATLAEAIESVLAQDFKDFELWILENGSSDDTLKIAKSFENQGVRVFDLGPIGFQKSLEWGINKAESLFIARMDADDICLPNRFAEQISWLQAHPEHVLCGSDVMFLTPFGSIVEVRYKTRVSGEVGFMHMSNILGEPQRFFGDPTVVFRREAALNAGLYDDRYPVGDVSLWIRMLQHHKGYQFSKPLLLYRLVPKSMSNTLVFNQQTLACRLSYYGERYPNAEKILALKSDKDADANRAQTDFWLRVALLELLVGNRGNYQKALKKAGLKMGLTSVLKQVLLPVYRCYHYWVQGVTYIPRKDLMDPKNGEVTK